MNEFAKNGEHVVINVPYAEAYIPYDLIGDSEKGKPNAFYYGEGVRATGLFNMRFFDVENEDGVIDRSKYPLRTFNYPNVITMYPSDKEVRTLKLSDDMEEDKYLILKFEKGDIMMSTKIAQNSKNCEAFMDLLIRIELHQFVLGMDEEFPNQWDRSRSSCYYDSNDYFRELPFQR